jgi:hypothetical protein
MKTNWITAIVLTLMAAYAIGQGTARLNITVQRAPHDGNDNDLFYSLIDTETGTRCYAVTKFYHEGTAISCVPKGK